MVNFTKGNNIYLSFFDAPFENFKVDWTEANLVVQTHASTFWIYIQLIDMPDEKDEFDYTHQSSNINVTFIFDISLLHTLLALILSNKLSNNPSILQWSLRAI